MASAVVGADSWLASAAKAISSPPQNGAGGLIACTPVGPPGDWQLPWQVPEVLSGAVQVYQAERLDQKIKVFHLVYEDSFEADKFMAGVDREASTALHCSGCNTWPA